MNRKSMITIRMGEAIAGAIMAAAIFLSIGCVNTPDEWSKQFLQSIADGLNSAISSLAEAMFLSVAI